MAPYGLQKPLDRSVPVHAQAKGKAGSPHRGDGRPSASAPEALEGVLNRLQVSQHGSDVHEPSKENLLSAKYIIGAYMQCACVPGNTHIEARSGGDS